MLGSVGLLIAQRLLKLGIKCTVFERESYLNQRSRDWSFGIYWAQDHLGECLPEALQAKLNTATVDPSRTPSPNDFIRVLNGKTAEELTRMPTPNVIRLKRSAFRALLVEGLDVQVSCSPRLPESFEDVALTNDACFSMAKSSVPFLTFPPTKETP